MNKKNQIIKYIISDFFSAIFAWSLFFLFRKFFIEHQAPNYSVITFFNIDFLLGLIIIPIFWLSLYYISGFYRFIYRKSFNSDISNTLKTTTIGVIVLFFTLLLDDVVTSYRTYYLSVSALFCIHSLITIIPRIIITSATISKIQNKKIWFNTLIIGSGSETAELYNELSQKKLIYGNNFIGSVRNPSAKNTSLNEFLPCLGSIDQLPELLQKHEIEEIIISIPPDEQKDIPEILNWLGFPEITVKAIPGLHNALKGNVNITNIWGTPLLVINCELMPFWQQAVKKFFDIAFAVLAIIILSPFFIICTLGVIFTSKGPILFKQERIGKNGKPFVLYKFRSMYTDAEKNGPNLSSRNDNRTTPFGKYLRSTKLDEIPNFFNVIKGEMSVVGPRPERQFYIEQIIKIAPQYLQLQKIKPGITSLGQVKFGYAENVEQMAKRLRYDLLYLENMSLYTDFLVIYYTIVLLFKGRHV
jgi:exopolysaccharide biosynthesis polyprenyl glycosylphosphotransferase